MKTFKYFLFTILICSLAVACHKPEQTEGDELVPLGEIGMQLGQPKETEAEQEPATRANHFGLTFAVNTTDDPTMTPIHERICTVADPANSDADKIWELDLQIYKSGAIFANYGKGCYTYDNVKQSWTASVAHNAASDRYKKAYFPNFKTQRIEAVVRPVDWDETNIAHTTVGTDQSTAKKLLVQDILVSTPNQTFTPAHIITKNMLIEHKNSLFNFIIRNVDANDLDEVTVELAGKTYEPYQVKEKDAEYMVVLPVGVNTNVNKIIVHIKTNEGAHYKETISLGTTVRNAAYCAVFDGLYLKLAVLAVKDWAYGGSHSLKYVAITAYPTMFAWENAVVRLVYDNNLTQLMQFNDFTMITVRPAGRTIVGVKVVTDMLVVTNQQNGEGKYLVGTDENTPVVPELTADDYYDVMTLHKIPAEEVGIDYDLTQAPYSPIILREMSIVDLKQFK